MNYEFVEYTPQLKALLSQIFTDQFMSRHSRFQTFAGFQYSSAVFVNWNSDQLVYAKDVFDNFVKESTSFSSWEEMVKTATDLCFS